MIEKYIVSHLSFSNIDWEYIFSGNGKKVVLFLNGGLRLAESAHQYIKILSRNYRVVVPTYPPLDNVDDMALGINEILKKEKIENAIVIGQSYGGMIAQIFSIKYPDKVEKLILNSTASIFTDKSHKRLWLIILWLFMLMPSKWIRNTYKKNILKALRLTKGNNAVWIKYAENIIDTKLTDNHIYSHFLTGKDTLKKYSNKDKTFRYHGETLIVNGEKDRFSTIKDQKKLIKDYPGSRPVIMKGAGHVFAIEQPDEYEILINEFINQ